MDMYEDIIYGELIEWKREMMRKPTIGNKLSKNIQDKMNGFMRLLVYTVMTQKIIEKDYIFFTYFKLLSVVIKEE